MTRAPSPGRPFNTSTPLGKVMAQRGLRVKDVEHGTGISYRTLSDYLADRKEISLLHLVALTEFFGLRASALRIDRDRPLEGGRSVATHSEDQVLEFPAAAALLEACKAAGLFRT